jgi:hypothetical protein
MGGPSNGCEKCGGNGITLLASQTRKAKEKGMINVSC